MTIVARKLCLTVDGEIWIHPFDLVLKPGSFTTVIGPTGAGKTSLLRMLAGLAKPQAGSLEANGRDVTGVGPRRRSVGMVYQEFVNYPGKTAFENIAAPLRNAGEPRERIAARVREVAEMVGLDRLLERYPLEMSGGQQQRLSIARTLAKPRDLVLLDEPLVNLDYKLREHFRSEFRRLFSASGAIVVYASSEPQEALLLDGDVIVMNQGKLLQHGRAEEVYANPANVEIAGLVGNPPMSLLDAELARVDARATLRIGDKSVDARASRVETLADGAYRIGLLPHDLGAEDTAAPRLDAAVEFVEVNGSSSFIYATHQGRPITIKKRGVHQYRASEIINFPVDLDRALIFDAAGKLIAGAERRAHG